MFGQLRLRRFFHAVAIIMIVTPPALAQTDRPLRGVALIIGQSQYQHLSPLPNPARDADAIEDLLGDFGFETTLISDRDSRRLARAFERFLEDAEEADMAVVYYAGHGIEAGGQNWLVPVDADLNALDALGDALVPLAPFVEKLQQTVPIAVIMLDACRDNPFPEGALARIEPGADPVPVTAGGLGEQRGVRALNLPAPTTDNLGTVIGFAAEPGKVALDGAPGENSPYAAALLRHLGAMDGEEFGTVMRMVAEEVYLNTAGRQRPWVNESLRRLLYFGKAPEPVAGAPGEILRERRQLLVSIAALPSAQRARAETLAEAGGVSMSVVYAMMQALGVEASGDAETVETRLRAQVEQFAALRASRQAFESADPEIVRLTALADSAEDEGALAAANDLREQAKRRVAALRDTRAEQVETLRQRIREDGAVYARSAETKKLLFRHADAADDYAQAAVIVADWDAPLAGRYRMQEVAARLADAELHGSPAALDVAERQARAALTGANDVGMRHLLALTLMLRSQRAEAIEPLREAASLLQAALPHIDMLEPAEKIRVMLDAGRAAARLASVEGDLAGLHEAERLFADAAALAAAHGLHPLQLEARFLLFQSIYVRWTRAPDQESFAAARAELSIFLDLLRQGEPDAFSARYLSKATLMAVDFAQRLNTHAAFTLAMEMTRTAREIFDGARFPLIVAEIDGAEGRIATEAALRFDDFSALHDGIARLRDSARIYQEAGAAAQLVEARWNLALALAALGTVESDTAILPEAVALLESLRADPLIATDPVRQNAFAFHFSRLDGELAARQADETRLRTALATLRTIRDGANPADLVSLMQAETALGRLSFHLAGFTHEPEDYRASVIWLEWAFARHTQLNAMYPTPLPDHALESLYADAASGLAAATGAPEDIARAISAKARALLSP